MYIFGAVMAAILAAAGGAYWYVSNLQEALIAAETQLVVSRNNEIELKKAIETQRNAIEEFKKDVDLKDQVIADVLDKFEDTRKLVDITEEKLDSLNIGLLSKSDPVAGEELINSISRDAARCFEVASGAPASAADNVTNPECPDLIPGKDQ